jgi:peptide-methionine (R)-S-oxide reductase
MKSVVLILMGLLAVGCSRGEGPEMNVPVQKTDQEWREALTPLQYRILRKAETERSFTGEYTDHEGVGTYHCAGCDAALFKSDTKFHSGCGWPSFDQAVSKGSVIERMDTSHGMVRTEVLCASCGGHLGHVFNDGPAATTGLRYCINSAALRFEGQGK